MNTRTLTYALLLVAGGGFLLAETMSSCDEAQTAQSSVVINDSNTPLHLMQPQYHNPYGIPDRTEVKNAMDRILHYLQQSTPAYIEDPATGAQISDLGNLPDSARLHQGDFRLTSYEWGVTYAAMVAATEATSDTAYAQYMWQRLQLIARVAPHFATVLAQDPQIDPQMRRVVLPTALDDAGAICTALIRLNLSGQGSDELDPLIQRYIDYIMNREYRLADGTFARNRPHHNTVWLDDMYMGVPAVAWYGRYTGDVRYYDEALRQIRGFKSRMWVAEKQLFRHGWVESMPTHPAYHWARANGWALLTMCEVLDALPEDYAGREEVLDLLRQHVAGLAACQSAEGFWHQLLDRNDSYLETSATAIYTYGIAHAINRGWIDAQEYGSVALLGWNAVSTQINEQGGVEGTCVGTGMGFDAAYYCYRPVHVMAAHGYGPALWAGAEVIRLLDTQHPKMNDSAVQFYLTEQQTDEAIFSEGVSGGELF
jgi:rhamnogalacturonyl hydrolase YesR